MTHLVPPDAKAKKLATELNATIPFYPRFVNRKVEVRLMEKVRSSFESLSIDIAAMLNFF
jgi:hypothetical protein